MTTQFTLYIVNCISYWNSVKLQLLCCNKQCMCISQLLLNHFPPLFTDRDWAGLDWIWSSLLIPWDHYAVWQEVPGNGECKNDLFFELFGLILDSSVLFTENNCCLSCCQILFASGVLLTIGLKPTVQFFTKPKNHKVLILSLQTQAIPVPFLFSANKWTPLTLQGSIAFGFGFFLVLIGWPALGMMVESYGFIMLFRLVISLKLLLHSFPGWWQSIFLLHMKLKQLGIVSDPFCILLSGFWPTAAVYLQKSPSFGWIFHHPFVTSVRS